MNDKSARLADDIKRAADSFSQAVTDAMETFEKQSLPHFNELVGLFSLPTGKDVVIMIANEEQKWLAWRAHDGTWDVLDGRGDATRMSGPELVKLGEWRQMELLPEAWHGATIVDRGTE